MFPDSSMYARHFGLRTEPFSLTPDPAFLYRSPGHAEALAALRVGLQDRRGLMAMTGEVGTGKTTLLYSLLDDLGPQIRCAYVANTKLSFDEILRLLLADFGVRLHGGDRVERLQALNAFLGQCATEGVSAAMIIDEAQDLDDDAFEHLRLLSNFETFDAKLLQIVLVGQPELETKLRRPALRQVAERIAVHCHINPLVERESRAYLAHRLCCAGGSPRLFTRAARRLLFRKAQGLPRRINILAHNALLFAYGRGLRRVTRAQVHAAVREREGHGLVTLRRAAPYPAWLRPAGVVGAASLAAAVVILRAPYPRPIEADRSALGTDTAQAPNHPSPLLPGEGEGEVMSDLPDDSPRSGEQGALRTEISSPHLHPLLEGEEAKRSPSFVMPAEAGALGDAGAEGRLPASAGMTETVVSAVPPPAPAVGGVADRTIVIQPGASLERLLRDIYGTVDSQLLRRVRSANPQITDVNRILAGDTLLLPDADVALNSQKQDDR